MNKVIIVGLAIAFSLFAFFGADQVAAQGRQYRAETLTQYHGNSAYDDTLTIIAAVPCTTEVVEIGHYQTIAVTAYDTLVGSHDSCLYWVVYCKYVDWDHTGKTFADTSYGAAVRIDSTVLYKRIQIAAGSTYVHTPKYFSTPADVDVGERGFFIAQPHSLCDSCHVEIGIFLQE